MRVASGRSAGAVVLALLTAACGEAPSGNAIEPAAAATNQIVAASEPEPKIDCAAPGSTDFAAVCTFEEAESSKGVILTLRHPDGGFRRLQITQDGRGVIAADGAEVAKVTPIAQNRIEVEVGGARYRLPATVRGQGK